MIGGTLLVPTGLATEPEGTSFPWSGTDLADLGAVRSRDDDDVEEDDDEE